MKTNEVRAMVRAGKPASKEITSEFVLFLMECTSSENLTDVSKKTGIKLSTLRDWAFEISSPWPQLEVVAQLMKATKLSPRKMLEKIKEEEAGRQAS
jgi:hypothetical protein